MEQTAYVSALVLGSKYRSNLRCHLCFFLPQRLVCMPETSRSQAAPPVLRVREPVPRLQHAFLENKEAMGCTRLMARKITWICSIAVAFTSSTSAQVSSFTCLMNYHSNCMPWKTRSLPQTGKKGRERRACSRQTENSPGSVGDRFFSSVVEDGTNKSM